jgi:hypothetical protein
MVKKCFFYKDGTTQSIVYMVNKWLHNKFKNNYYLNKWSLLLKKISK